MCALYIRRDLKFEVTRIFPNKPVLAGYRHAKHDAAYVPRYGAPGWVSARAADVLDLPRSPPVHRARSRCVGAGAAGDDDRQR